jgi:PAS domain S-box-containing protein
VSARARILVIDDDVVTTAILERGLTLAGYECAAAADGPRGLAELRQHDYDVVLTDLEMPGLDGFAVLADLREADFDTVPLVLTGHGDVPRAVEAMRRGAFDFLTKPVDFEVLQPIVARAVELARARRHGRTMQRLATEWETTFDACSDLIAVVDAEQRVLRCNLALSRQLGLTKNEIAGRFFSDLLDGGTASPASQACVRTLAQGVPQQCRVQDRLLGGHFDAIAAPLFDAEHRMTGAVCFMQNVTERERTEAALRASRARLVEVQEEERRRLARKLHDEVGQTLTGLKLLLEMLPQLPLAAITAQVEQAKGVLVDLMEQVRTLALDLRPAVLEDLGLVEALHWYFDRFTAQTGVRIAFVPPPLEGRLPSAVETTVYRIVQEALTNVARHAHVGEVEVRLWQTTNRLGVQVRDQGTGFDPAAPPTGGGLTGMQERVTLLDGKLAVDSAPGQGTSVTAELPLTEG